MTTIVTQTVTMARITYTKTAGRRAGTQWGRRRGAAAPPGRGAAGPRVRDSAPCEQAHTRQTGRGVVRGEGGGVHMKPYT